MSGIGFLVWMCFFDPKDIRVTFEKKSHLRELQRNEQHLNETIAATHKELDQLKTNAQTVEKYAREQFLMKKDNEELFVVAPPKAAK